MWRKACLREPDALWSLICVGSAVITSLVLVVAGYLGWPSGFAAGFVVGVLGLARFRARRRRWDRLIEAEGREAVAAAELILRQHGRGSSA
jgi:hypothetical protein